MHARFTALEITTALEVDSLGEPGTEECLAVIPDHEQRANNRQRWRLLGLTIIGVLRFLI